MRDPDHYPARGFQDGPMGPARPLHMKALLQALAAEVRPDIEMNTTEMARNACSDSELSHVEEEKRQPPAGTLRRNRITKQVNKIYDLAEKNDELCEHLEQELKTLRRETLLWAEDKWGTDDPFKLQKGKRSELRKGRLPGDGRKAKKR